MEKNAEQLFNEIGNSIENAVKGNLFGKQCFKINGKPFISLFDGTMVFKLTGDAHLDASSLDGSRAFDPSQKGRPMKEWVQVPFHYSEKWDQFARDAADYLQQLTT